MLYIYISASAAIMPDAIHAEAERIDLNKTDSCD